MTEISPPDEVRVTKSSTCYLCGAHGDLLGERLRDRLFAAPGTWNLLRCPACGLVWLDPRPDPRDIGKLYRSYFTHSSDDESADHMASVRHHVRDSLIGVGYGYREISQSRLMTTTGRVLTMIGPLREAASASVMWLHASQRGRILDVGCGDGRFLARMQRLGWEVVGLEPDPDAVRAAKGVYGLDILCGDLDDTRFPRDSFDVITMSHVIEHVANPIIALKECRRILKPGGRLVLVTPNTESLGRGLFNVAWVGWDPPRHLYLFTPGLLETCVSAAGLTMQQLSTTSNAARFVFQASSLIRRDGIFPGASSRRVPWHISIVSLLFWALEYAVVKFRPWGEDILMIASKTTR